MRFITLHKLSIYMLVALNLIGIYYWNVLHPLWLSIYITLFLVSWFSDNFPLNDKRYTIFWNIITVLAFIGLMFRVFIGNKETIISSAFEFALFILINRLFNRKGGREYLQIALISLILFVGIAIYDVDLWFVPYLITYIILFPWNLILLNLRFDIEFNYSSKNLPQATSRILNSKRIINLKFMALTSIFAIVILTTIFVVFIFFPRIGLGIFSLAAYKREGKWSFGPEITIGDIGNVELDNSIVFRYYKPQSSTPLPQRDNLYWRVTTYSYFDGKKWKHIEEKYLFHLQRDSLYFFNPSLRKNIPKSNVKVILTPIYLEFLPIPSYTYKVQLIPRENLKKKSFSPIMVSSDKSIMIGSNRKLALELEYYTADYFEKELASKLNLDLIETELSSTNIERFLQLPHFLPESIKKLSTKLLSDKKTNIEKARSLIKFFYKNFKYDLNVNYKSSIEGIEQFLFKEKKGYCEYFATSMVLLLRVSGVPSRIVAGYLGGTLNKFGNYYTVSNKQAHSWVEVYDPSYGWIEFDPTPPVEILNLQPTQWKELILQLIDVIKVNWYDKVIGYDLEHQKILAFASYRTLGKIKLSLKRLDYNKIKRVLTNYNYYILSFAILIGVTLIILWRKKGGGLIYKLYKGKKTKKGTNYNYIIKEVDKIFESYNQPRKNSTPPLTHYNRLKHNKIITDESLEGIITFYNKVRFGDYNPREEELNYIKRTILNLRKRALKL